MYRNITIILVGKLAVTINFWVFKISAKMRTDMNLTIKSRSLIRMTGTVCYMPLSSRGSTAQSTSQGGAVLGPIPEDPSAGHKETWQRAPDGCTYDDGARGEPFPGLPWPTPRISGLQGGDARSHDPGRLQSGLPGDVPGHRFRRIWTLPAVLQGPTRTVRHLRRPLRQPC